MNLRVSLLGGRAIFILRRDKRTLGQGEGGPKKKIKVVLLKIAS